MTAQAQRGSNPRTFPPLTFYVGDTVISVEELSALPEARTEKAAQAIP